MREGTARPQQTGQQAGPPCGAWPVPTAALPSSICRGGPGWPWRSRSGIAATICLHIWQNRAHGSAADARPVPSDPGICGDIRALLTSLKTVRADCEDVAVHT